MYFPPGETGSGQRLRQEVTASGNRKRGGAVGTFALPPDLGHGLAEVHVDAAVVDEHVVHLEVGLLTVLLLGAPQPQQDFITLTPKQ